MKLKLGFDIHGVLDSYLEQYISFIKNLDRNMFEIHIVTGVKQEPGLKENPWLKDLNYTKWFSIHEECEKLGVPITFDEHEHPWVDREVWDRQKALYCEREGLFALIDDSPVYHKYFTGNCLYLRQMNGHMSRNNWRHYDATYST